MYSYIFLKTSIYLYWVYMYGNRLRRKSRKKIFFGVTYLTEIQKVKIFIQILQCRNGITTKSASVRYTVNFIFL